MPVTIFLEAPSFIKAIGNIDNKSILDLACGEGYYTRLMKERGAASVLGVDLSPDMIALARDQEQKSSLGIEYLIGDVSNMSCIGSFDIVTAVFLFNYACSLKSLNNMMNNVAVNLRSRGQLVSVVPNPQFKNDRRDTIQYGYFLEEIERFSFGLRSRMTFTGEIPFSIEFMQWDRQTYETSLSQAGFRDICWTPFTVSDEGVHKLGAEFWQATLENPKSIILSATKV